MQNCVLVVGNGFSISLLHATDLSDRIVLGSILPPDESVRYLPFQADRFDERPLWDQAIWPLLWKEYHLWKNSPNSSTEPWAFFGHLARTHTCIINKPPEKSIKIEDFRHVTYELRYYLWQLFRYYEQIWTAGLGRRQVEAWDWWRPLRYLASNTNLTVISFNYDCFFDSTLYFRGQYGVIDKPGRFLFHPKKCCEMLGTRQPGDVVLLKPHGSMMWEPYSGVSFGQNPWISQCTDINIREVKQGRREYPVTNRCVLVPDLVPPGHNEKHLIDMDTDVFQAVPQAIAQCDALVLCGLRAGEPDTAEVERYLSELRDGTPAFHFDRCLDTPAGDMLKRYSPSGYHGLDLSQVATIHERVCAAI